MALGKSLSHLGVWSYNACRALPIPSLYISGVGCGCTCHHMLTSIILSETQRNGAVESCSWSYEQTIVFISSLSRYFVIVIQVWITIHSLSIYLSLINPLFQDILRIEYISNCVITWHNRSFELTSSERMKFCSLSSTSSKTSSNTPGLCPTLLPYLCEISFIQIPTWLIVSLKMSCLCSK